MPSIKTLVQCKLLKKMICKACRYTTTLTDELRNFLTINVLNSKTTLTLQGLIDQNLAQWKATDIPCDNCSATNRHVRYSLSSVSKILVIVLTLPAVDLKTGKKTKKQFKIKAVPSSKIKLCGHTFKVISAIFHSGEHVTTGH